MNFRPPRGKKSSLFGQSVACGVVAVFCWFNYRTMWQMGILFTIMCVLGFWLHFRRKAKEEEYQERMDELQEELDNDETFGGTGESKRTPTFAPSSLSKRERKAEYNRYMQELDDELGDFDIEDYDDTNDE